MSSYSDNEMINEAIEKYNDSDHSEHSDDSFGSDEEEITEGISVPVKVKRAKKQPVVKHASKSVKSVKSVKKPVVAKPKKKESFDIQPLKEVSNMITNQFNDFMEVFETKLRNEDSLSTEVTTKVIKLANESFNEQHKSAFGITKEALLAIPNRRKTTRAVIKVTDEEAEKMETEVKPMDMKTKEVITVLKGTNVKHGITTRYYDDNKKNKRIEKNYRNGKVHGKSTKYNQSGEIVEISEYVNNKRHGVTKVFSSSNKTLQRPEGVEMNSDSDLRLRLKSVTVYINGGYKRRHTKVKKGWESRIYHEPAKSADDFDETGKFTEEEIWNDGIKPSEQIDESEIGVRKPVKKESKVKSKKINTGRKPKLVSKSNPVNSDSDSFGESDEEVKSTISKTSKSSRKKTNSKSATRSLVKKVESSSDDEEYD
jgi:antitoxin component YwqK of YwqJK toxin-antitoxin module